MCALPSTTKLAWENFLKNDFYKSHLEKAKNNSWEYSGVLFRLVEMNLRACAGEPMHHSSL